MINWQLFPKSNKISEHLEAIVQVFAAHSAKIDSKKNDFASNTVLSIVSADLISKGFLIEKSKKRDEKIKVPVLFGRNGVLEKSFDADGVNQQTKTVLEVEAGRGVVNNQFLKDLFQACMMHDIENLVIAVRNTYKSRPDFDIVTTFFETLYASGRLSLPLKNILIIGY
jgi:hypothetical protein